MKKLLSLSLMLSLGLTTVTPALNAAQSQIVAQSQANPADVSGWQAAKKWWQSGRNMKALNRQEKKAFRALKRRFTLGAIIAAIVAIIGGGAAYFGRRPTAPPEAEVDSVEWQLIKAARRVNADEVERLIARGGVNLDAFFKGYTALMWAVIYDNQVIVNKLLDAGADVNAQGAHGYRYTPLMIAVVSNHGDHYTESLPMVDLLLQRGASKTIRDAEGQTAESLSRIVLKPLIADYIRDFVPSSGRTVKRAVTGPDINYM